MISLKEIIWEIHILISLFTDFFQIYRFYDSWKDFLIFPRGIKEDTEKKWVKNYSRISSVSTVKESIKRSC